MAKLLLVLQRQAHTSLIIAPPLLPLCQIPHSLGAADCSKLEFWTNRIASTDPPLEISQTQIPLVPDQTAFLQRWNEFHQGFRTVKRTDGTEYRNAVLGEPWGEVSPGFLPRTLDQLRARRVNDSRRPENRFRRDLLPEEERQEETPQQSLEDALENLLNEASDHEGESREPSTESQRAERNEMPPRASADRVCVPRLLC